MGVRANLSTGSLITQKSIEFEGTLEASIAAALKKDLRNSLILGLETVSPFLRRLHEYLMPSQVVGLSVSSILKHSSLSLSSLAIILIVGLGLSSGYQLSFYICRITSKSTTINEAFPLL